MLIPRYTERDKVWFVINGRPTQSFIIKGPYREGIWWEYLMADGSMVRDYEIVSLIGRVD